MSQRDSGYQRIERDAYETPAWVTHALLPHLPDYIFSIWEPACGSCKMVRALCEGSPDTEVIATDISGGFDFLSECRSVPIGKVDAIITNPPYELATAFIERALRLMEPHHGAVAMLLRCDFDHAKSRAHLFRDCPAFAKKIVLTRRIVWFEGGKSGPSFNHAWFLWDWRHEGPPTIGYGP